MQQLEHIASQVYKQFMTTEAYHRTLGTSKVVPTQQTVTATILDEVSRYREDPQYSAGRLATGSDTSNNADQLLGNTVLFMRDVFWYLEIASAIPEGDTGRVHEIMKVRVSIKSTTSAYTDFELAILAASLLFLGFRIDKLWARAT